MISTKTKIDVCDCSECESFRADVRLIDDDKSVAMGTGGEYIRVTDIEYHLGSRSAEFISRFVAAGYGRRGVLGGHRGRRPRIVSFEVSLYGRFPVYHPGSCNDCGEVAYGVWQGPDGNDVMFCYGCADGHGCY